MSAREHALVQDADDQNAVRLAYVKDDVASNFETMQTRLKSIAGPPNVGSSRQQIKALFKFGEKFVCLVGSPSTDGVGGDQIDVALSAGRNSNLGHDQALVAGNPYFLRMREKTPGSAISLAIPFLIAALSARILSSCSRSSFSRRRRAARITSLALA